MAFYGGLFPRLRAARVHSVSGMTGLPPWRDVDADDHEFGGLEWTPVRPSYSIDYHTDS